MADKSWARSEETHILMFKGENKMSEHGSDVQVGGCWLLGGLRQCHCG